MGMLGGSSINMKKKKKREKTSKHPESFVG